MKCSANIVNTARVPLVDRHARDSRHPGGTALDTIAVEPVPAEPPLPGRANVVLAPHVAGASIGTVRIAAAGIAKEVRRCLSGERPLRSC